MDQSEDRNKDSKVVEKTQGPSTKNEIRELESDTNAKPDETQWGKVAC